MLKGKAIKSKKKTLQIASSKLKLIKSAGLIPIIQYFEKSMIPNLFHDKFKEYRQQGKIIFSSYDYFRLLLFQLLDGHVRIFHHRFLANNYLMQYIIDKKRIPHFTSIIKFISSLHSSCINSLKKIQIEYALKSIEIQIKKLNLKTITIDIDSTAGSVFGKQEGVAKGYNPDDKNEKCIHLQLWTIRELKLILFTRLRHGNTHCSNGIIRDAKFLIPKLKNLGVNIRFVADSGYDDKKLMYYLDENNVGFVIAQKQFATTKKDGKCAKNKKVYFKYKAVIKSRNKDISGMILTQVFVKVAEAIDENGQLFFPEFINERFTNVIITNMDLDSKTIYRLYRNHAIVETVIEEIKNEFSILKSKGKSFKTNQVFTQMISLAYNLKNNYARDVLELAIIPKIKTLRSKYIQIPGYFSNISGKTQINILDYAFEPMKKLFENVHRLVYT